MRPSVVILAAIPLLFGGPPPPLEPHFRAASPRGWVVEGKQEGRIEWMRFSESAALDGEDYAGSAITLYRIGVDREPAEAGAALTGEKLDKQGVRAREPVDREVEGIRWRGFEADYASESGTVRRESYLYAVRGRKTLYLFWARGPSDRLRAAAPLVERSLRKVSEAISGDEPKPDGARAGSGRE